MNDFTKEELRELKIMIMHIKRDYPGTIETCIKIQGKIQSMIDNYCENE